MSVCFGSGTTNYYKYYLIYTYSSKFNSLFIECIITYNQPKNRKYIFETNASLFLASFKMCIMLFVYCPTYSLAFSRLFVCFRCMHPVYSSAVCHTLMMAINVFIITIITIVGFEFDREYLFCQHGTSNTTIHHL